MDESFIVEAESMSLETYFVEANSSASGGQLISLGAGFPFEAGSASFEFEEVSGQYDVVVHYLDRRDGIGRLEVEQNGATLDSWNFARNFFDFSADEVAVEARTVATEIDIATGDSFTLAGQEFWQEGVEIDYVEFIPINVNSEPSILALEDSIFSVDEAAGTVEIPVVRTGNLDETVSLSYRTFEETAVATEDFTSQEGSLTFEPGEASQNITVAIANDQIEEPAETFSLTIDNVVGNGTLDAPRTARITINDDDTEVPTEAVILAQSDDSTEVVEGGAGDSYTLTLGRQPSSDVTIALTSDAQVATDIESLTFTPENWNQPQTVSVSAIDDALVEGEHQGVISHSLTSEDPVFEGLAIDDVTVQIQDNDSEGETGAFVLETFASGFNKPTAIDWTPNGEKVFVAQQDGVVRLVENGTPADTPFIDISDQVNNTRDRGLLGLAVHPDFPNQPYVYLAYTYDPPEVFDNTGLAGPDANGNRPSQVIRVEADPSTNFNTAIPGSEVVIAGTNSTWENISRPDANSTSVDNLDIPPSGITPDGENIRDYLATDSESHSIGGLQFGTDGSLFISNGDGTSYNVVDPRTVRVQDLDNLSGKVLRVDPLTGEGLSDNPFFDGDPNSNRSKVYNYGLRNPFRFTIDPNTNQPVIGDVGWKTWEEINTSTGANFGWPYFEGGSGESLQQREYQVLPEAQEFYDSGASVTPAIYARNHNEGAVAIIMGDFYEGGAYPDRFDGALFYSDFGDSTIRYLTFEEDGVTINTFQDDVSGIVQLATAPDGNLYGVDRSSGQIINWRFEPEAAPEITGSIEQPTRRSAPLQAAADAVVDRRSADGLSNPADDFLVQQSL